LSLVPVETKMLFAVQPAALLERDEARSLARSIQQGASAKALFVVPLEDVDQLFLFWEGLPEVPGQPGRSPMIPPPSGIAVHSNKAQDWNKRLGETYGAAQEFRIDGNACFRVKQPPIPGWCGFTPDDRTLVLTGEDAIRDLIQDRKAPPPKRA